MSYPTITFKKQTYNGKKRKQSSEQFEGGYGGSDLLHAKPAEQSLSELTVEDFMAYPPENMVSPDWKITRYPVSKSDFKEMCDNAQSLQPEPLDMQADASADEQDDTSQSEEDFPEDGIDAREESNSGFPEALAPPTGHSFRGIMATGWEPPDCTLGVGPNDVLLGANVELAGFRKMGHYALGGLDSLPYSKM